MSSDPGSPIDDLEARVGPEHATFVYSAPGGLPRAVATYETWSGAVIEVVLARPGAEWRPVGISVRTNGRALSPEDVAVDLPTVMAALLTRMGARGAAADAQVTPQVQRRGRTGYADEFYRVVAVHYLRLCGAGVRQGLHEQIALEMRPWLREQRPRPAATVRTWVREAARRGYLAGITAGRTGAVPGPRFYE